MSDTELLSDETNITEITIDAAGRVFVFGTSRGVLDVLVELDPRSIRLKQLQATARELENEAAVLRSV